MSKSTRTERSERKDQTIDLGIFWWRDAAVCSDETKLRSVEDLPLQQSAGVVVRTKGITKLLQNKNLSENVKKDDEITGFRHNYIERGIVIRLKIRKEQPKKGIQVYEIEI